jgi:hypothetical protein
MLVAIVYALTPDARWDARHNHGQPGHGTGWAPILAAIAALMIGGIVLMGTIAYGVQKFFEWQLQPAKGSATGAGPPRSRTEATALSRVGQPLVCSDQTGPVECERR